MRPMEKVIARFGSVPRRVDAEAQRFVDEEARPEPLLAVGCGLVLAFPLFVMLALAAWLVGYWWLALVLAPALLAVPVAMVVFDHVKAGPRRRDALELVTNAPLVVAHVVQANTRLYEDEDAFAPALLAYSTDPGRAIDLAYGQWLAQSARALKGQPDPGGDLSPIWRMVNRDRSGGRVRIPPAIAGNGATFLHALPIHANRLPGGDLSESDGLVPLLHVNGDVEQIPVALVRAALGIPRDL